MSAESRLRGRDLTAGGYQRFSLSTGPTRFNVGGAYMSYIGSGVSTGDMDVLSASTGDTGYLLLSWRTNGVTPTVAGGTDIGGGTKSSGTDWHSRIYKATLGAALTMSATFSASTEFIASTYCINAPTSEDFVTLQANGSSTNAANTGGTVTTGLVNVFLAHCSTGGVTWTEPSGFSGGVSLTSDGRFGSLRTLEFPGTSGAHNATLGTAAKSATAVLCLVN